ncbi:hypothetical protein [Streptomyces sp. cmx-18-6]|uniref:hypothetical protein n=1 Tax=Streptomyces sp. cmx-18-6 TaxID=2790930 RepID=UPI00397FD8D1
MKVFGALLCMLLFGVLALFVSQRLVESGREDVAFGRTVDHAERHARTMTEQSGALLADRRSAAAALESDERGGHGISTLYAFQRRGSTATEVVLYTVPYEKAALPFSSGTGAARRCFTIVYAAVGTPETTSHVTAHDSESSCAQIAEEVDAAER